MAGYVRVVRGTFDLGQLDSATSFAASVAEELKSIFEHFDHLESLKTEDGLFLWLAYFRSQTPMARPEIQELMEKLQTRARDAEIRFEIQEFGSYDVTYSGAGEPPRST
jgi:hypothetical protein